MKKYLSLLLIIVILLPGCSFANNDNIEPVDFYYLRSCNSQDDYDDFFLNGAIVSESREASGHRNDMHYLLAMYLRGPLSQELTSLFPPGISVVRVTQDRQELSVLLNAAASNLTDMELTIACACLAKTCMALTDVSIVRIESRGLDDKVLFSNTFSAENMLLSEPFPVTAATEETQ